MQENTGDRLERAIAYAAMKHAGQKDKIGEPYILHPLRVMLSLNTEAERIVAILHDILEDTDATTSELLLTGFTETEINAVIAISKTKNQKYEEYLEQVKANKLALNVKKADIRDNSNPARLYLLEPDKREYLRNKYQRAQKLLEEE